jgi:histidine phosphotransferase ChpT
VPPAFEKLVPGNLDGAHIDAHAVQPYYTGLLARTCGMKVTAAAEGADVVITARSSG